MNFHTDAKRRRLLAGNHWGKTCDTDNELLTILDIPLAEDSSNAVEHYQQCFTEMCRRISTEYDLCIGDHRYTLLELEVYLTAPNHHHADPYCHSHPMQKRCGHWFFHRAGMSDSYRAGSRKGLDITIGNPDHLTAGGILIRAVQDQVDGRIFEGPSVTVDMILRAFGHTSVKSFVKQKWDSGGGLAWQQESGFYLARKVAPIKTVQFKSCRIGLGVKNRTPSLETRLSFVGRPYRFVIYPKLLRKGRILNILDMMETGVPLNEIQQALLVNMRSLAEYHVAYQRGITHPLKTLRECISQDILGSSKATTLEYMSAIHWWTSHAQEGQEIASLLS